MRRIHQIGCGAVGCEFIKELSKMCVSQASYIEVDLYDFDEVEERNVCSQSFDYYQIGMNKAEAAAKAYSNPYLIIRPHNLKVTQEDLTKFEVDKETIIIDAVDHLPTRKILWFYGYSRQAPVLHLALSTEGTGVIGWNHGTNNGYVFDFLSMPKAQYDRICENNVHLPPCELNSFRAIISNVGIYGAISVGNYYGIASAGPLYDWLKDNNLGKTCADLCAAFRVTASSVEFKKKPDTFYLGE